MKKLILSLTVAACAAATGLAQAQDEPKKPAAGAGAGGANRVPSPEDRLKMLTASLGLTQEQQDKVKKIMDDSRPEFEKIRSLPQEERRPKFRELTQKQTDQIAAVLTPEQRDKYKTAMANRGGAGQNRAAGSDANATKKEGDKPAPEEKK